MLFNYIDWHHPPPSSGFCSWCYCTVSSKLSFTCSVRTVNHPTNRNSLVLHVWATSWFDVVVLEWFGHVCLYFACYSASDQLIIYLNYSIFEILNHRNAKDFKERSCHVIFLSLPYKTSHDCSSANSRSIHQEIDDPPLGNNIVNNPLNNGNQFK